MNHCFLSHSSANKSNYVRLVAERLPKSWRTYDEDTFEHGMKALDEILKSLGTTSLFVLFISEESLSSDWVKKEILEAKELEMRKVIKRIFPIIIDPAITHKDERIPDWMREEYNLRLINRPVIATRAIIQRLRELSWADNPKIKERQKIFVGRNSQLKEFEERFDDYSKSPPSVAICSGIPQIGRKTLLKHGLVKANINSESYSPLEILLTPQDSIEDFIVKVYDLGLSNIEKHDNFLEMPQKEKIDIATNLCKDIIKGNEMLFVEDNGCLVTHEQALAGWFKSILDNIVGVQKTIFAIASKFKLNHIDKRRNDVFYTFVPELTKTERMGLFNRVSKIEGLDLKVDDFNFFENLLFGYPEQVFFTVNLIKDIGLPNVKKKTELLVEFNSDRASIQVETYAPSQDDKEFLYLLSEFDFISYGFLEELADPKVYQARLERFLASGICESLGSNGEYIRLNDIIRDYMRRSKMSLPTEFNSKIEKHCKEFIESQNKDDIDASNYLFTIRKSLIEGKFIDKKLLIPSHFLKAMRDLYDNHHKYSEVVTLADRVLESKDFMDSIIVTEIRYYLCQSLARLKDPRFLAELQHVRSYEHNFLLGFYYRLCGRTDEAITKQLEAIKNPQTASRARRELVQLYVSKDDFISAQDLAEKSYQERPSNPFHIQAYLTCLLNLNDWDKHKEIIERLLEDLNKLKNEFSKADEMYFNALAQYQAYCLGNYQLGLETIQDAIDRFPDNLYPYFTKFNILYREKKSIDKLENLIRELKVKIKTDSSYKDVLARLDKKLQMLKQKNQLQ